MTRAARWFKYWLPVVVWAGLIFSGSSDTGSVQHTSRILGPLFHWLFPDIAPAAVAELVYGVRKAAHVTEFALLALLVWRALRQPLPKDFRAWSWSEARLAFWLTAAYAGSDEFHQLFVPSREARIQDVMIDATGAGTGLLLLWAWGRWRKHW